MSAQYIDHNVIQEDHKNSDDHLFLLSAAKRYGMWYSEPGNGVSHPIHMQRLGKPGKTLLGSDSHTCAAGRGIEYYGTGFQQLRAMDRHVIANMGAELGNTSSVFPSDEEVHRFLKSEGREDDWIDLQADAVAEYDVYEGIDLSSFFSSIA